MAQICRTGGTMIALKWRKDVVSMAYKWHAITFILRNGIMIA